MLWKTVGEKYMPGTLKYLACCLLAAFSAMGVHAQSYIARSQFFGVENGLSHREVNAIYQDKQGFMWFGTHAGLNRFDGYSFTWHTRERDGLAFNDIESITEDDNGYLWLMGPFSQPGIMLYHPLRRETVTFKEKFGQDLKLHGHSPRGQLKRSTKGVIYFLADAPLRLMSYHTSRGLKSLSLPANWHQVGLASVTERGTIWGVVNDTMLIEFDSTGRVLKRYLHNGPIQLRMGERQNGVEFYYTTGPFSGDIDRIFYIDIQGNRSELPLETLQQDLKFVPELIFRFDSSGMLWSHYRLLSAGGATMVDVGEQFPELGEFGIRSFCRDRSGALWIGGNFGVYRVQVRPNRFNTLLKENSKATLGEGNACRGLVVDDQYLYVNSQKDGLFRLERKGNQKQLLYKNPYAWGHFGLYESAWGYLYSGATGRLFRYTKATGDTLTWTFPTGYSIWAMYQTNQNTLLVGGSEGMFTVDLTTNTVQPFKRFNQFTELAGAHILYIAPDKKGQFWICSNSGLYAYDPATGVTARYWSGGQGQYQLPADDFQHFYQDEDGTYWIATAYGGLLHWDKTKGVCRQFTRVDGLSNNNVYAVYPDALGNLWLSSDNGLMQFNRTSGKTRTYLVRDGIAHNEFNRLSHFQDKDGRLYFGGLNGITTFHPGSFFQGEKLDSPPLRIASFQQFDGSTNKLTDRTAMLDSAREIIVYPGDRFLVFELSLLTYEDQTLTQYAYMLEGVDKDWNYQKERILRLSGLPYGQHRLRVRGQSADGSWSADEVTIPIQVMLPLMLRPWFLLLMGLLLVGSVYGFFRLRNWQHKQQQVLLEQQIAKVTAKLKQDNQTIERQAEELRHLDALKSRFFANVSHELRTPLTLMLSPLNTVLKNKKLDDGSRQLLNLASENGEQLLRLLAEILDLSKLESGKLELNEKSTGLQSLIRKQVAQFEALAQRFNINLTFEYQAREHLVVMLDVKNTERILNNLLSNAMKFTPAGGNVKVQVVEFDDTLEIRVRDNGRGIHPDDLPHIFDRYYQSKRPDAATEGGTGIGLALSYELARLFGGSLRAESAPGKGSTFYFKFPKKEVADEFEDAVDTLLPEPYEAVEEDENDAGAFATPSKPRLLVVEDHDSLLQYLLTLLKPDFHVTGVRHGREALEVLKKDNHGIDLILSDIMMPVMDGFQLLEQLKSNDAYRHLPVVMLTARADWTDKLHALRLGVDDYLLKPFREEELRARIDNLLSNVVQRKVSETASAEEPQPVRPLMSAEEHAWLEDVEKVVQQNLADTHFNVDQLSDMLFISRRQLNRRLQQLTGLTPVQYIREARLAHARRLLENRTYTTVKSVVLASGMTDTEHFAKLFREKYGRAPSDYAEPTPGDARNDG